MESVRKIYKVLRDKLHPLGAADALIASDVPMAAKSRSGVSFIERIGGGPIN